MAEQHSQTSAAGISKVLRGIDFPASRQDLVQHARSNNAGHDAIQSLQQLEDREYQSMADVEKSFGRKAA